jgi:hypothetical protein
MSSTIIVRDPISVPDDGRQGRHAQPLPPGRYELIRWSDGRRYTLRQAASYRLEITGDELVRWTAKGWLFEADR